VRQPGERREGAGKPGEGGTGALPPLSVPPVSPPQLVPRGHHARRGREPAAGVPGSRLPGAHQRDRQRQVLHRAQVSGDAAAGSGGVPAPGRGLGSHTAGMPRLEPPGVGWGGSTQVPGVGSPDAAGGTRASRLGAGASRPPPCPRHIVGSAGGVSFLRKRSPRSRNNRSGTGTNRGGRDRGAGAGAGGGGWRHRRRPTPTQDQPGLRPHHRGPDQGQQVHAQPGQRRLRQRPRGRALLLHREAALQGRRAHGPAAPRPLQAALAPADAPPDWPPDPQGVGQGPALAIAACRGKGPAEDPWVTSPAPRGPRLLPGAGLRQSRAALWLGPILPAQRRSRLAAGLPPGRGGVTARLGCVTK